MKRRCAAVFNIKHDHDVTSCCFRENHLACFEIKTEKLKRFYPGNELCLIIFAGCEIRKFILKCNYVLNLFNRI